MKRKRSYFQPITILCVFVVSTFAYYSYVSFSRWRFMDNLHYAKGICSGRINQSFNNFLIQDIRSEALGLEFLNQTKECFQKGMSLIEDNSKQSHLTPVFNTLASEALLLMDKLMEIKPKMLSQKLEDNLEVIKYFSRYEEAGSKWDDTFSLESKKAYTSVRSNIFWMAGFFFLIAIMAMIQFFFGEKTEVPLRFSSEVKKAENPLSFSTDLPFDATLPTPMLANEIEEELQAATTQESEALEPLKQGRNLSLVMTGLLNVFTNKLMAKSVKLNLNLNNEIWVVADAEILHQILFSTMSFILGRTDHHLLSEMTIESEERDKNIDLKFVVNTPIFSVKEINDWEECTVSDFQNVDFQVFASLCLENAIESKIDQKENDTFVVLTFERGQKYQAEENTRELVHLVKGKKNQLFLDN